MGDEELKDLMLIRELNNDLKLTLQMNTRDTIQRFKTEVWVWESVHKSEVHVFLQLATYGNDVTLP